jgi:hypothetical protein
MRRKEKREWVSVYEFKWTDTFFAFDDFCSLCHCIDTDSIVSNYQQESLFRQAHHKSKPTFENFISNLFRHFTQIVDTLKNFS